MINKKLIMVIGMVLLVVSMTTAGIVFFGGNAHQSDEDGLVLDIELSQDNYDSGTKVFSDSSGEGNDGTSVNAATFTADKYGKSEGAMNFNGANDRVTRNTLVLGSSATFEGWAYADTFSGSGPMLWNHPVDSYTTYFDFLFYTGLILMNSGDGAGNPFKYSNGTNIPVSAISLNTWHHYVVVLDANANKALLYFDGVNLGNATYKNPTSTSARTLGIGGVSPYLWNGSISNFKIYDRSLSATEIQSLYNSSKPKMSTGSIEKGLVGHWALDSEGYNSATERITDKTPYENHGANFGAELTIDRMGQSNRAMSFDASDYINCGGVIDLGETTATFWFKSDDKTAHNGIIDFAGSAGLGHFDFNHYLDRPLLYLAGSNYRYFSSEFLNYLDGNWHFVVLYIKGAQEDDILESTLSVDLNNISADATTHAESPVAWNDLHIGKTSYGSFNGSIADVRIYNRALSADEIETLYYSYRPKAASGSLLKGLVLDMPLTSSYLKDETGGSEIMTDRTPYSNDGQNYGATVGSDYTSFDGNGYINCGKDDSLDLTSLGTVAAWAKIEQYNIYPSMIGKGASAGWDTNGYGIELFPGDLVKGFICNKSDSPTYNSVSFGSPELSTWHHYVLKWDGSYLYAYLDGIQTQNTTQTLDVPVTSYDFLIGKLQSYFNGSISSVKVYNRALSAEEIKLLYDKGR